jgi:ABC-2 type transport system permease protein
VQPILWLGVFGTIMGRVNAIPTGGLPYIDYITPGVLLQSTIFVSVFYGLTIVWERETGILKRLLVAPTSIYATVIGRSVASGVRAVVQALIMPLFFASNALYPIDMMPSALQLFAVLNPLTYAVDAIRGLMISGELGNILVDVLAILVFDMVVFALASLSFRKIIE